MKRFWTAVSLAACLAVPATLTLAQAPPPPPPPAQDDNRGLYDQEHNDYHQWNSAEDSAWRRYLSDHHRTYHDFAKASDKEQKDYWKWRHAHPRG